MSNEANQPCNDILTYFTSQISLSIWAENLGAIELGLQFSSPFCVMPKSFIKLNSWRCEF